MYTPHHSFIHDDTCKGTNTQSRANYHNIHTHDIQSNTFTNYPNFVFHPNTAIFFSYFLSAQIISKHAQQRVVYSQKFQLFHLKLVITTTSTTPDNPSYLPKQTSTTYIHHLSSSIIIMNPEVIQQPHSLAPQPNFPTNRPSLQLHPSTSTYIQTYIHTNKLHTKKQNPATSTLLILTK